MSNPFTEWFQRKENGQRIGFDRRIKNRQTLDGECEFDAGDVFADLTDLAPNVVVALERGSIRQLGEYDQVSLVHGRNKTGRDGLEQRSGENDQSRVNDQHKPAQSKQSAHD